MHVAFDADDTLWHNEDEFQAAHREFESLLSPWATAQTVDECLYRTEMRNLDRYGYGVKSFALAMVETAIEISGGRVGTEVVSSILSLGHHLLDRPARLIEGVHEVLDRLSDHHLMIITKGDLTHQLARIDSSGLAPRFEVVEVVAEKDRRTYADLLAEHSVPVTDFVMVGNSMRSDIAPIAELGGRAIHVPYHVTWAHESDHQLRTELHQSSVVTVDSITDVPAVIESWS